MYLQLKLKLYYYNLRGDRVDQLHQQHQADRQSPVCVCVCVCVWMCVYVWGIIRLSVSVHVILYMLNYVYHMYVYIYQVTSQYSTVVG